MMLRRVADHAHYPLLSWVYESLFLYPLTYPAAAFLSTSFLPSMPLPFPSLSNLSLCDPVYLDASVSRSTAPLFTVFCKTMQHASYLMVLLHTTSGSEKEITQQCFLVCETFVTFDLFKQKFQPYSPVYKSHRSARRTPTFALIFQYGISLKWHKVQPNFGAEF